MVLKQAEMLDRGEDNCEPGRDVGIRQKNVSKQAVMIVWNRNLYGIRGLD